ncbi:Crp/Fnr family transcriptional regulator [Allorhizobium sonneratiae]|uniref:Crp/Fnr family transcriptional regulator n=1 Tax=Allorhizobium sonneratiae TaxID=2934936 RepID=UPI003B849E42
MNKTLTLNNRDRTSLAMVPLMTDLSPASLAQMLELSSVLHYETRDILFQESDKAEFFYCVLSGFVRLYRLNKDGREADIRVCGAGETFGECLVALGGDYPYNAQVAESAIVVRFDIERVRMLSQLNTDVARAIIRSLSGNLVSTMTMVANDRLQTATQRVAHYLLSQCQDKGPAAAIRLPFQKSLLAGKLGLAPEALSRAFSALRPLGVNVRGRRIDISDVKALSEV